LAVFFSAVAGQEYPNPGREFFLDRFGMPEQIAHEVKLCEEPCVNAR
jgi:hypothetical protein